MKDQNRAMPAIPLQPAITSSYILESCMCLWMRIYEGITNQICPSINIYFMFWEPVVGFEDGKVRVVALSLLHDKNLYCQICTIKYRICNYILVNNQSIMFLFFWKMKLYFQIQLLWRPMKNLKEYGCWHHRTTSNCR